MEKKDSKKILKTYFHYVLQNKWLYTIVLSSVLLIAFLDAIFPFLSGSIVDKLSISAFEDGRTLINILIVSFVIRGVLEEILFSVDGYIDLIFLERKPKIDYVKKIQSLDYRFHSSKSTGSLISISSRINNALNSLFNRINIWGIIHVVDVLVSAYFIYTIDIKIAAMYLLTIVVAAVIGYPLLKWNTKVRKQFINESDKIGGVISDNMIGFETVKAFGQEKYEIERLEKKFDKWQKEGIKYIITFRFFDVSVYIITIISAVVIINMAYQRVLEGLWSTGELVTLIGYSTGMVWKTFNIVYKAKDFMKATVDLKKFVEVMETEPSIVEKGDAKDLGKMREGISFRDLSFTYTESEDGEKKNYVLDGINFDIGLGESVALVGKSGSGKTTLAKLLMRYYDVDRGSITINGIDVRDLKLKSLRGAIGLVPQDPTMFNESIKYNISYGNHDASMEQIEQAARSAALHSFIGTLPKGYNTVVGERGIKLSGGQRQRLAIARVMLENPEIVVFDEATSQLDSENEQAIQLAFGNLTENKTTVIIAHRLSTIMHADKIVVFDEGRIVESGTHNQLMSKKGIYAMLWKLQTEN